MVDFKDKNYEDSEYMGAWYKTIVNVYGNKKTTVQIWVFLKNNFVDSLCVVKIKEQVRRAFWIDRVK